jgi:hypothetical protein
LALVCGLACGLARAVVLPTGLGPSDVDRFVSELGPAAATRLMRSAESYDLWPGIKAGIELLAIPMRDIPSLGAGNGVSPSVLPAPRFYIAKGLPADLEIVVNFMPFSLSNTVATWGGALKWNVQSEAQTWAALAGYLAYTRINGFDSAYLGNDIELGVIASKDLVRLKPFLGAGFIAAQGTLDPSLVATATRSSWQPDFHLSVGTEIELPVNFTVQLDFMNFYPMGSVLVAKKF